MWIMIGEVLVFSILLALIIGYFGGFWLTVNQETHIDAAFSKTIKWLQNEKKNSGSWDKVNYRVERLVSYNAKKNQYYKKYKIIITDEKNKPLPENKFKEVVEKVIPLRKSILSDDKTVYTGFKDVIFSDSFIFDPIKDVSGDGSIWTVARYHNVWTYNGKRLDLLVKVVWLKNLNKLYINSSTPKGFKTVVFNQKGGIGFFVPSSKLDPSGTDYQVTLEFQFVKADTHSPVNINFDALVNDIDNTTNRKEMIILPHNSYYAYKVSSGSFVYWFFNKNTDSFYDVLYNIPKNYPFDTKNWTVRFWDIRLSDPKSMLKLLYKNTDKFRITFSVLKKVPVGKTFGKAGFILTFWQNKLLTWCGNFYRVDPYIHLSLFDKKIFNNMLIYSWDITKVNDPLNYFGQYKLVLLFWLNLNKNNFANTYKIINSLSGYTEFIGTVKMKLSGTDPFRSILYKINLFKDLGIKAIYLQWFDLNKWKSILKFSTEEEYKNFVSDIISYANSLWLKVISDSDLVNNWFGSKLSWVVNSNTLNSSNFILRMQNLLNNLKSNNYTGAVFCYLLTSSLSSVNKNIIQFMDKNCSYKSIQTADLSSPLTYDY